MGEGVIDIPGARVEALRRHPRPKSRRQLREFLGMINYYRRFIQGFHECSSFNIRDSTGHCGVVGANGGGLRPSQR